LENKILKYESKKNKICSKNQKTWNDENIKQLKPFIRKKLKKEFFYKIKGIFRKKY
jgi:hypothetical protein